MKYIGIIGRPNNNHINYNNEIINIIYKYKCLPLCISVDFDKTKLKDIIKLLDICDGFILQGGNEIFNIDLKITKYLYDNDIPTLGICMGMQTMCLLFDGKLKKIDNHYSLNTYVHPICIRERTKLYDIIKKSKISVNSRHHEVIEKTNLDISSYYNCIESVEDRNKKCFIGVQWHPESIMDKNNIRLFNYFFSCIK